jgi:general L-amino acid transport system permease protein
MKNPVAAPSLWRSLFYSPLAGATTLVLLALFSIGGFYLWKWGISDAVFRADFQACFENQNGACWGFVTEKWRLILFGRYPYDEQWRPGLATAIIALMLVITAFPSTWNRKGGLWLCGGWIVSLGAFFLLMQGGVFSLSSVDSDSWGGLPLTVILTLLGMTLSAPIGILLAIGRRSKLGVVRSLSIGYIELVRGIPLITVLFVATFIFPLVLPPGFKTDPFWRIVAGIVLFQAAYMAETVRGGLQTIPKGQFEVSDSLGLTKAQSYLYIILPQALATVIPAFVNSLLSTFMDTSLVTIVSMYDLTGSLRLALGDPNWRIFFLEGYLFIAAIYFVSSFILSRYSLWLENRINKKKTVRGQ